VSAEEAKDTSAGTDEEEEEMDLLPLSWPGEQLDLINLPEGGKLHDFYILFTVNYVHIRWLNLHSL